VQTILALLTVENVICAAVVDILTRRFHLGDLLLRKWAPP